MLSLGHGSAGPYQSDSPRLAGSGKARWRSNGPVYCLGRFFPALRKIYTLVSVLSESAHPRFPRNKNNLIHVFVQKAYLSTLRRESYQLIKCQCLNPKQTVNRVWQHFINYVGSPLLNSVPLLMPPGTSHHACDHTPPGSNTSNGVFPPSSP